MVSYRLVIGIIVGIAFSFFTGLFFDMDGILPIIQVTAGSNALKIVTILIGWNFEHDFISFFTENPSIVNFFAPQLLACIFIGYLSGSISKGVKRGLIASSLVTAVDLAIWWLLSVLSGEDLAALFQGAQLIATVGGIISALIGAILGGLIGGLISGPYEEVY
ncbi:MAG: hypothetical protein ACFFFB_13810 [Candidatus Heimdallarchaeota archaeon]